MRDWWTPFRTRSLLVALLLCPPLPGQEIAYRLSMPEPWTHCFEVELTVNGITPGTGSVDLLFPAWRSGRYQIFDFAGGVVRFSAADARGNPLPWRKVEKGRWRVTTGKEGAFRVSYTLFADEFRDRTRGLNAQHGFVDGTAVFLYPDGMRNRPLELRVDPFPGWHVTTSLNPVSGRPNVFSAPTYELLADSPLEIGTHREIAFEVLGKNHLLAIYGTYDADPDSLVALVSWIVQAHAAFWGGALPYERYVFFIHAFPGAGGGTEHANSCVVGTAPFPAPHPVVREDLLSVLSHEFFHTWNVKRLRPKGMAPYDWTKENYYRELWLAEGGTSYLHGRSLARYLSRPLLEISGITSWIDADRMRPGNRIQSLTESSFDAWIKSSRRSARSFNYESDFYGKGAMTCALMDLEIRHRSRGRNGFEELIRALYRRFPEGSPGYTVEDVEQIATEIAGEGMREFFARYVYGSEAPEWERFLGYAGLELDTAAAASRPWWGVHTEEEGGRPVVRQVVRGSSGDAAGLQSGDEIVAIDRHQARSATMPDRIGMYRPGDTLRVMLIREERLLELSVPLARTLPPAAVVRKSSEATELQRSVYREWTGTPW